jgi:hypothetical protein
MKLVLGWYFHLPPCHTEAEFDTCADGSLALLIAAHESHRAPAVVAITGHLLSQIERRRPALLTPLRGLIAGGTLELAATTYYEIAPHLVSPSQFSTQLEADFRIKQRLFGVLPSTFWSGNFGWSPIMGRTLGRHGIRTLLLDEPHLRSTTRTQLWKWLRGAEISPRSYLVDTGCSEADVARPYALDQANEATLTLLFRSTAMHHRFSFGVEGCIHQPWDDAATDSLLVSLKQRTDRGGTETLFLGDDGDRINAVSIHQYKRFLKECARQLQLASCTWDVASADRMEFLCAHASSGLIEPNDLGGRAYLAVLAEIADHVAAGRLEIAETLPLYDVFPLFWTRISRSRWFYDRAQELLDQAERARRC